MRVAILLTALLMAALPAFAQVPAGTAITYQGELAEAGQPIDGAVDLKFTVWDDSNAGAPASGTLQLDNVDVAGGIFTAQLDFGAGVFTGEARWLEIEVRSPHDPSDSEPFTALSPRQAVTAAPFALNSLSDGHWTSSGSAITNTNSGFVGINRNYPITGAEVFGVHSPNTSNYGGMYIDMAGDGLPFYGYKTPTRTGWTFMDGSTGDWYLHLGGLDRLAVTYAGDVGIGTTAPEQKLDVNGTIRSRTGGFMFPDGTLQTTAAAGGAGDGHSLDADDGSPTDVVYVDNAGTTTVSGFLGVGRSTKISAAEAFGIHSPSTSSYGGMYIDTAGDGLPFYGYKTPSSTGWSYMDGATGNWYLVLNGLNSLAVTSAGNVGIGTAAPSYRFDVRSTDPSLNVAHIGRDAAAASGSDLFELQMDAASSPTSQYIEAQLSNGDVKFRVNADGNVTADGAFTGGGADFAEIVKVEAGATSVEAGDVMVIDRGARRGFAMASGARSTLVAGVYSTQPGVMASPRDWDALDRSLNGANADGENAATPVLELARQVDEVPLAVVGIVPCKVSAENGPIAVGDLLVTAATPGHAMRDDAPAVGTVLGKALEPLPSGRGVIEIMVTLQ